MVVGHQSKKESRSIILKNTINMKLKFNKTEDGDIAAVILDNTKQEVFSYIKMIAALLDGQPIECEYGEGITPEEQEQIKSLKEEINILSTRVDKHNNLVERMSAVEQSTKSAHHRIDHLEG